VVLALHKAPHKNKYVRTVLAKIAEDLSLGTGRWTTLLEELNFDLDCVGKMTLKIVNE
jgi:hypothetical protein